MYRGFSTDKQLKRPCKAWPKLVGCMFVSESERDKCGVEDQHEKKFSVLASRGLKNRAFSSIVLYFRLGPRGRVRDHCQGKKIGPE